MAPAHVWYIYGKDENGELHQIINGFTGEPLIADNERAAWGIAREIVEASDGAYIGCAIMQLY